jgi:hypothetical protein
MQKCLSFSNWFVTCLASQKGLFKQKYNSMLYWNTPHIILYKINFITIKNFLCLIIIKVNIKLNYTILKLYCMLLPLMNKNRLPSDNLPCWIEHLCSCCQVGQVVETRDQCPWHWEQPEQDLQTQLIWQEDQPWIGKYLYSGSNSLPMKTP